MADKKISQLTGASTPLAGTEVLPIVQSGSTVKVSAADITAGRNISASGVTISGGTVDGVVYLNASKAATTGGTFVFNGTNMGIGTGSPDNLGRLTTEGSGNSLNVTRTSGAANRAGWVAQNTAETVRLFSEVYGASATNTGWGLTLAGYSVIQSTGTSSNGLVIGTATSDPIIFGTADTNRGQFDTSGNLKIENGNLVVGTAAKGIDFSANTHAAGMTSELLDWYEEGTFTPVIYGASSAGSGTYTTQVGEYTRIGNRVFFLINIAWSAHTGTGSMRLNGFPFASSDGGNVPLNVIYQSFPYGTTAGTIPSAFLVSGATPHVRFAYSQDDNTIVYLNIDSAATFFIAGSYKV